MKGKPNKIQAALHVCSVNINRSTNAMHALTHNIANAKRHFDLVLIQEPWWNGSITTSFQGWQVILPTPTINDHERPRVVAYYRLQAEIEVTLRTDIGNDLDYMILDIKRNNSSLPTTRIINIYNQRELSESQNISFTAERLAEKILDTDTPTIITGDWNLHHPNWDSRIEEENVATRTQETVDWLEGQGYVLYNERDVYTRGGTGSQQDSVIDLTFANETAHSQGLVQEHTVDPDLALLSDHHTLMFTIGDPRIRIENLSEAKFNWKGASETEFTDALNLELHAEPELWVTTISQVLNENREWASPTELDKAVEYLNGCMERAAQKTVPPLRLCSRSKPWWNNELTEAFREMRTAREMARTYFQHFKRPSNIIAQEAKDLRKKALSLVRSAKREFYRQQTEEATAQNIWDIHKWTKPRRTYISPALSKGEGEDPAVSHIDKCNLLRATLFPPQPTLTHEPHIDLEPKSEDMVFYKVTKHEVHNALYTMAPAKAPGIMGMTGRAYQWAWSLLEDKIFHLV